MGNCYRLEPREERSPATANHLKTYICSEKRSRNDTTLSDLNCKPQPLHRRPTHYERVLGVFMGVWLSLEEVEKRHCC